MSVGLCGKSASNSTKVSSLETAGEESSSNLYHYHYSVNGIGNGNGMVIMVMVIVCNWAA